MTNKPIALSQFLVQEVEGHQGRSFVDFVTSYRHKSPEREDAAEASRVKSARKQFEAEQRRRIAKAVKK